MESRAFHICPFCQATSPVSVPRCPRCRRSLAGLTLPVYGSELDAALAPPEAGPLIDLPLRGETGGTVDAASTVPPPPTDRPPPPAAERRRIGRRSKIGIAAAIMVAMLVGGWLVRAQDRHPTDEDILDSGAETSVPAVPATAPTVPATVATAAPTPVAALPAPASPVTRTRRAAGPPPEPPDFPDASRLPARTAPRPAEVSTVRPDVRAAPVGVERARDRLRRDRAARDAADRERVDADTPDDAVDRAELRAQLRRAVDRREVLAAHVARLRARTNVPVVKDVEQYQRDQEALSAVLDRLDATEAEVERLRRVLAGDE